jgi:hypothetical protein
VDVKAVGQIAYEAYGEEQGWQTPDGCVMAPWHHLDAHIQAAWAFAAQDGFGSACDAERAQRRMERDEMEAQSLGQVAYDAYGEQQAWTTFDGKPMPSWPSVRRDIALAWEQAGRAVARHLQAKARDAAADAERVEATHG